jgi:enoyl-CoA hydratase/carnithine racemase
MNSSNNNNNNNKYPTLLITNPIPSIQVISLNRPSRLNALSMDMINDLLKYFHNLEQASFYDDEQVDDGGKQQPRVIILKGEGKGFCAGLDLQETHSNPNQGFNNTNASSSSSNNTNMSSAFKLQRRISEIMVRMRRCPQPIISLLHGACTGGGLALALASDVRLATKDVKMNVAMATIGLSGCDVGISYFLPRAIGLSRANEMMLTGKFISGDKADKWGLVNDIFDSYSALESAGIAMAKDMLKLAPLATQLTKQGATLSATAPSLEAQIALEDRQQTITLRDGEFQKRVKDFIQNKKSKL